MKKVIKEIVYQNGTKLAFCELDDSNVRGFTPITDFLEKPIYEGNEFFAEKFIEENYSNYKELEASYLRYLQTAEDSLSISDYLRQYALDSGCLSAFNYLEVGRGAIKKGLIGDVVIPSNTPGYEELKLKLLSYKPVKRKKQ